MANLEQIKRLNEAYGKTSPLLEYSEKGYVSEAIDPKIIKKGFSNPIADLGPSYYGYFEAGLPASVALLFIDVSSFSTKMANANGEEIAEYFDKYYDIIIPLIYKHGGEVDKVMGDGIICLFGPPFLENNINDNIMNADQCAKDIIDDTLNTEFASKVALHSGEINYFQNKTGLYHEYTMIGKPVTELFRLESISEDNSINFYSDSTYGQNINLKGRMQQLAAIHVDWMISDKKQIPAGIKGIDFQHYQTISKR
tara:strand:+ start:5889 stop:6650 length:762 start_codon:yes stop_codon:yes gene_type:complete